MPSAPYYRHEDPTGSALNNVAAEPAHYDELINKPRIFTYKPNYGASAYNGQQGISHPAPVYYANQPQPQTPMAYYANQPPSHSPHYYYCYPSSSSSSYPSYYTLHRSAYAAAPDTPMGYYYSQPQQYYQTVPYATTYQSPTPAAYCYPHPPPTGAQHPGYPYPYPTGQASGGTGHTILPDGTSLFLGKTKEQVMWENQQIAANTGANDPVQMVPYKAAPGQQFWCRELDGSWTLRNVQETMTELQPGYWDKGQSGHAVFIRQKP